MQIHILLIDDNKDYCKSLKNRFWEIGEERGLNIQVTDFQNLEEGFAELTRDSKYKAIILDAKCLRTKAQETEDFQFLPEALDELEKIDNRKDTHTPFVVNTGYYDTDVLNSLLLKIARQKGKLFDKSTQEEEMLEHLLNEIDNAENTRIEKQYEDVFEVFEKGFLSNNFRTELLNILKNMKNPSQNQNVLRAIRVIQDEIYNSLNRKNSTVVPNVSFTNKNKHLSGNIDQAFTPTSTVYQTNTISFLANAIYRISSDFGNHPPQKPTNVGVEYWEMPSKYAVQSLTFALLEQLIWFNELMEKP